MESPIIAMLYETPLHGSVEFFRILVLSVFMRTHPESRELDARVRPASSSHQLATVPPRVAIKITLAWISDPVVVVLYGS